MQIPTFREASWSATVAVIIICLNVSVFLYEVVLVKPWSCTNRTAYSIPSTAMVIRGLSGMAYAFGGHGLFPEQLREMRRPEEWRLVMRVTYGFVTPLYLLMACLGYFSYRGSAHANLNANYPHNTANMLTIVAQTVQELYFVFFSVLALVLQLELCLGVDPTIWCHTPAPPSIQLDYERATGDSDSDKATNSSSDDEDDDGRAVRRNWREWLSLRRCNMPPMVFRLVFRTAFLGSMVLLAESLTGGQGDILLSVQALAGSVGYVSLTYFLPLLFGWFMLPRASKLQRLYHGASFVFCLALAVVGVYYCVQDLVENAGGLNSPAECRTNATMHNITDGCTAAFAKSDDDA